MIKNCYPKYTKKFLKLNIKKINPPIKNQAIKKIDTSQKKINIENKHMRRYLTTYIIKEL